MRISFYFFLLFSIICFSCKPSSSDREVGPLTDGLEEFIPGEVYVMHSLIYAKNKTWTTSNIFIIKGTSDTVWIYGTGYGDFTQPCNDGCNDNNFYLGMEFTGTGPAVEDVRPVDSVITNIFHLERDSVILQFIVPHYHNDHINEEFIDAFYSTFHYPLKAGEKIWVHINDSYGALCGEPCCGTEPCPDKKNVYYGVPYLPAWKPEYKNMFATMGKEDDPCNTILKTFTTAKGNWHITKALAVKDGGHTDGTVNLQNEDLKIRIAGTKSKAQCALPKDWSVVTVHGNVSPAVQSK